MVGTSIPHPRSFRFKFGAWKLAVTVKCHCNERQYNEMFRIAKLFLGPFPFPYLMCVKTVVPRTEYFILSCSILILNYLSYADSSVGTAGYISQSNKQEGQII